MFVTGGGGGEDRGVGRGPRVAPSIPLRNESHCNDTEQPLGFTDLAPNGKRQRAELEKMRKMHQVKLPEMGGGFWI